MLAWLKKIFGLQSAVEKRRDNPVLIAAIEESANVYTRTSLSTLLDSAAVDALSRWVYLETNAVCNAPDPQEVCRQKLAETMLRYALYQVLMIPPEPEEDVSGLRGLSGISGELAPHLRKLAMRNVDLVADTHENEFYDEGADLQRVAEIQYWRYYWLLHTLNRARKQMGDYYPDADWFEAFRHATCAAQENRYRIDLDLPSAFRNELQSLAPTAYSIFTDIVVSGAADPVAEWCDYHRGQGIPEPGTPPDEGTTLSLTASNSQ